VFERDAKAAERDTPVHPAAASAPVDSDWIQDVVSELPRLLTTSEAAKVLRMSPRNIARIIVRGRLKTVRTGSGGGSSRVLIARAEMASFLQRLDGRK